MEEPAIKEMVCLYAAEEWVSPEAFVKKENYFRFESVLIRELNSLEQAASKSKASCTF